MKNVLLVDDDKTFNFISTRLLELTGMAGNILTAWNGKQALDLFERNQGFPDVILLDLNMPVMDGFEFLEAFNTLNLPGKEQVKIVILSSSVHPKDIERAQVLGAHRYVRKPLEQDTLIDILAS
jgi:CheY-like chemotaxis protein